MVLGGEDFDRSERGSHRNAVCNRTAHSNDKRRLALVSPGSDGALDRAGKCEAFPHGRHTAARVWAMVVICDDQPFSALGKRSIAQPRAVVCDAVECDWIDMDCGTTAGAQASAKR